MTTTLREEEKCIVKSVMNEQSSENQETPMAVALRTIKTRMNDLRRLEYIIKGEEFSSFYKKCSSRVVIDHHLQSLDIASIEQWIESQKSLSLDTMSIKDLRDLGRRKGVKMYNSLRKHELIDQIVRRSSESE